MIDLALDDGAHLPEGGIGGDELLEEVGRVADRDERVAQLVAEHREELVLAAVHGLERLRGVLAIGDVHEGQDRAVDHVVHRPVRVDALHVPAIAVLAVDLLLVHLQRPQHLPHRGVEVPAGEARHDVGEGPADVALDQAEELPARGGEALDAELLVEEDGGDVRAGEDVAEVAVGGVELRDAVAQLAREGRELLVDRLHLLPARGELLVGRLHLLVHREELFVGRLELLVRRLPIVDGRLQVDPGPRELVLELHGDRIVAPRRARRRPAGGRVAPLEDAPGARRRRPRARASGGRSGRPCRRSRAGGPPHRDRSRSPGRRAWPPCPSRSPAGWPRADRAAARPARAGRG